MIEKSQLFPFLLLLLLPLSRVAAQKTPRDISQIGNSLTKSSDIDAILEGYKIVLQYRDSLETAPGDQRDYMVHAHTVVANLELKLGQLNSSENTSIAALALIEQKPPSTRKSRELVSVYNNLGRINSAKMRYKRAIDNYTKAIDLIVNTPNKIIALNNLGHAYHNSKKYDRAIAIYLRGLQLVDTVQMRPNYAKLMDNLGYAQFKAGLPEAEENLQRALEINNELKKELQIINSHIHLTDFYQQMGDRELAIFHAESALRKYPGTGFPLMEISALKNYLSLANDSLVRRYTRLTDSLNVAAQNKTNKFSEARYNMELKERETTQLQQRNEYLIIGFAIAAVLLLIIILLAYARIRQRNKLALLKESMETEHRIAVRIHDELANDMYHTMVRAQSNDMQNDALLEDLDSIYHRIRDISAENTPLETAMDFDQQLKDMLMHYQTDQTSIILHNLASVHWDQIPLDRKTVLYRCLQELLVNMKKHSNASHVYLSFAQTAQGAAVTYRDNGTGGEIKKGNGLSNVETRTRAVNGTFTFGSMDGGGFQASLKI